MNSFICFLTVFHLFKLTRHRLFVSKVARRLIYLGIFLPLGDYVLRFVIGDLWFYSGNLIFHSIPYQALFWGTVSLLVWVYSRNLLSSLKFLLPILGLVCYMLFSIPGTEHLAFWSPISGYSLHLDWVNSGYLIPTTVALLLLASKRWSEISSRTIGRISLSVLIVFLMIAGVIRNNAKNSIPENYREAGVVTITPANNLHTEWQAVNYRDGSYYYSRYHFVQGFQQKFQQIEVFDDYDTAQGVLMDHSIKNLWLLGFKNPLVQIQIQNEALRIDIKELHPSYELLWIKEAQVVRNRSGKIVDFSVRYGTFI